MNVNDNNRYSIQDFLKTNPTLGQINDIIYQLTEYKKKLSDTDRIWRKQLPRVPEWGDSTRQYRFKCIFWQLMFQGISTVYSPQLSSEKVYRWILKKEGEKSGTLIFYPQSERWQIERFYIADEEGNPLPEFDYVESL